MQRADTVVGSSATSGYRGRDKVTHHTVVQRSDYTVSVTTQSAMMTSSLCGGRDKTKHYIALHIWLCYVLLLDFALNVTNTA